MKAHRDLFELMGALTADKTLNASDLRVAFRILGHMNREREMTFVSDEMLAVGAGCDERQVRRTVPKLVSRGWFKVTRHQGRGLATEYYPCWEKRADQPGFTNPKNRADMPGFTDPENRADRAGKTGQIAPRKQGGSRQKNRADLPSLPQSCTTDSTTSASTTGENAAAAAAYLEGLEGAFDCYFDKFWPEATSPNRGTILRALSELLVIADGDDQLVSDHLCSRMAWLKENGKPAPQSPLFVRDSLKDVIEEIKLRTCETKGTA